MQCEGLGIFVHFPLKNMLLTIILKSKNIHLSLYESKHFFFNVEGDEKTKCGLTFGRSCQIHNQLDQSFVGSCPLILRHESKMEIGCKSTDSYAESIFALFAYIPLL